MCAVVFVCGCLMFVRVWIACALMCDVVWSVSVRVLIWLCVLICLSVCGVSDVLCDVSDVLCDVV